MPGFDVRIARERLQFLSEVARTQLLHYAYFEEEKGEFVLSGDDDRFTNHSDDPNTCVIADDAVAARDIQEGEEITADYRVVRVMGFIHPEINAAKDRRW